MLLTLDEVRQHVRSYDEAEDEQLLACAEAAESHIESVAGLILTPRPLYFLSDYFPHEGWTFAQHPVNAVSRIDYVAPDGSPASVPLSDVVFVQGLSCTLRLADGASWPEIKPGSQVKVEVAAGYPWGECPAAIRRACLLLTAYYFGQREAASFAGRQSEAGEMPFAVSALLAPHRRQFFA